MSGELNANPPDEAIRALLEQVRTIAVIGIKSGEQDDAFRVSRYLQAQGYRVLPVSPKLQRVLGEPVSTSIEHCSETPDLVDLFRASEHVPAHTSEILRLDPLPRAVWLQLGIVCPASRARLEAAGLQVVEDRCLLVEHRRLIRRLTGDSHE